MNPSDLAPTPSPPNASDRLKVLCIFGTRPEAIKMAPLVSELRKSSSRFACSVCITAQHRQLLDDVLTLFEIVPEHDLDIMREAQSPAYVAAAVLTRLEELLAREQPDWILVQGDTTTTMGASLAAFYQNVRVGHVEAGLRTGDKWRPFPEEINRRIVSLLADLHFAPTSRARDNLLREGVAGNRVVVTGNTVIDALMEITQRPFDWDASVLRDLPRDGKRLILVTTHRRESFGPPLQSICRALLEIAHDYHDSVHIALPVHLNPRVAKPLRDQLSSVNNISLLPPLDYLALAHLLKRSYLVLTDSGGIQEEAPSLGVPVLVLREVTERPEAVEAGVAKLVGTDRSRIVAEVNLLLQDEQEHNRMARAVNPYGDGLASKRIVQALLDHSFSQLTSA